MFTGKPLNQRSAINLGLERALLEYNIIMGPNTSGEQRQRAAEIDAQFSGQTSRKFDLGKKIGNLYFAYVDERYGLQRRQYQVSRAR